MLENVEKTVQFVNEKKISSDASVIQIIYTAFEVNIVFNQETRHHFSGHNLIYLSQMRKLNITRINMGYCVIHSHQYANKIYKIPFIFGI